MNKKKNKTTAIAVMGKINFTPKRTVTSFSFTETGGKKR